MDPDTGRIHNPILFFFQILWIGIKLALIPVLFLPVMAYLYVLEWRTRSRPRREGI